MGCQLHSHQEVEAFRRSSALLNAEKARQTDGERRFPVDKHASKKKQKGFLLWPSGELQSYLEVFLNGEPHQPRVKTVDLTAPSRRACFLRDYNKQSVSVQLCFLGQNEAQR